MRRLRSKLAFALCTMMLAGCVMLSGGDGLRTESEASGGASSASAVTTTSGSGGGEPSAAQTGSSSGPGATGSGGSTSACVTDADCPAAQHCQGDNACADDKLTGSLCGGDGKGEPANECASGHCVDGVCCDSACDGVCEACLASKSGGTDGLCAAVTLGSDPDGECAADPASCIAGGCSGAKGSCMPASKGAVCRSTAGACDQPEICDGVTAACPADAFVATGQPGLGCWPFLCDGAKVDCPKACGSSADCTGGHTCSGGCVPQRAVSVGAHFTCVRRASGGVRCWGRGLYGRLGYGSQSDVGDDEKPKSMGDVSVGVAAAEVATGDSFACIRTDAGKVRCWGYGSSGSLGYGNKNHIGDNELPSTAGDVPVGGVALRLALGGEHACVIRQGGGGAVRCWGDNDKGQLGLGHTDTIGDDELPSSQGDVSVGGGGVIEIAAGRFHTCALLVDGSVRCWGEGQQGQLGYGNTDTIGDDETPDAAGPVPLGGVAVQLAAGDYHTCALLSGGKVRCWGLGQYGQLGYGNTDTIGDDEMPQAAGDVNVGSETVAITAGGMRTCALLSGGKVRCWGSGLNGALGYGDTVNIGDNETPQSAGDVSVGGKALQVATGPWHTCVLLDGGTVRCWGSGNFGALGYGNENNIGDNEFPSAVGPVPFE